MANSTIVSIDDMEFDMVEDHDLNHSHGERYQGEEKDEDLDEGVDMNSECSSDEASIDQEWGGGRTTESSFHPSKRTGLEGKSVVNKSDNRCDEDFTETTEASFTTFSNEDVLMECHCSPTNEYHPQHQLLQQQQPANASEQHALRILRSAEFHRSPVTYCNDDKGAMQTNSNQSLTREEELKIVLDEEKMREISRHRQEPTTTFPDINTNHASSARVAAEEDDRINLIEEGTVSRMRENVNDNVSSKPLENRDETQTPVSMLPPSDDDSVSFSEAKDSDEPEVGNVHQPWQADDSYSEQRHDYIPPTQSEEEHDLTPPTAIPVASAISGEDYFDEDVSYPVTTVGVEYDPQVIKTSQSFRGRPNYQRRKWVLILSCFPVIIVLSVAVGMALTGNLHRHGEKTSNSDDANVKAGNERYPLNRAAVEQEFRTENIDLDNPKSPYAKALHWITYNDTLALHPVNDRNFLQRYILAYFYYATTVNQPWNECNQPSPPSSSSPSSDLQEDYNQKCSFFDPVLTVRVWGRFLSALPECQWVGISCRIPEENGSVVTDFVLPGISHFGTTFPKGISHLSQLTALNLGNNGITGSLPSDLSALTRLVAMNLGKNFFTGNIPAEWKSLSSLASLTLQSNRLSGSISSEIGAMFALNYLDLRYNTITHLPSTFHHLTSLGILQLDSNSFKTIPSTLWQLTKLEALSFSSNPLSSSRIPEAIFQNLTELMYLDLSNCNLVGTLSTSVAKLRRLGGLHLSENELSGTIPTELGTMGMLSVLHLEKNRFGGSVPPALCHNISQMVEFELQVDCAATGTNAPEVYCEPSCCTSCCNAEGVCTANR